MKHLVTLRKRKEKDPDWPLSLVYQVVHVDTELVEETSWSPKTESLTPMEKYEGGYVEWEADDEDEYYMEAQEQKKSTKTRVRTWFLIAHPESGEYRWVTTEEVRFVSLI